MRDAKRLAGLDHCLILKLLTFTNTTLLQKLFDNFLVSTIRDESHEIFHNTWIGIIGWVNCLSKAGYRY